MKKTISFPSEIESVRYAENMVDEISDTYNFNGEMYGNVLVSVVEGVNNAIIHGNRLDSTKKINFTCEIQKTFVIFTIKDEGDGFRYSDVPDPTAPNNINNPHGRGIFIISHLADEINYFDNGTKLEMKFILKK